MFEVVVEAEVIDGLVSRLDLLSAGLTHAEWAHLVAFLGLGSTALAAALGPLPEPPSLLPHRRIAPLGSPSFARALNGAAEVMGAPAQRDRLVEIVNRDETAGWEIRTAPRPTTSPGGPPRHTNAQHDEGRTGAST